MTKRNLLFSGALLSICCSFATSSHGEGVSLEWAKSFGSAGSDAGRAIAVDQWGNVYTTGFFWETVDFDPGPGVYNLTSAGKDDIFISKVDASGKFVWARRMGGNAMEQNLHGDQGAGITVDPEGNVYTTGYFTGTADFNSGSGTLVTATSEGEWDIFITKHDTAGKLLWVKTIGGDRYDFANAIAADTHYLYITGKFVNAVDFEPGSGKHSLTGNGDDIFVCKLENSTGTTVWARQMTGNAAGQGIGIAVDESGNVYSTGIFSSTFDFDPGPGVTQFSSSGPLSLQDVYISKLDKEGNFVWAKQIGGVETDMAGGIALDPWDNVLVTGRFANMADFDPGTGSAYLTSTYNTMLNLDFFPDAFIVKLNSAGDFSWAKQIGGQQYDEGYSIKADAVGNIFATGYINGTANLDTFTVHATNGMWDADVYVTKLDSAGNFKWVKTMGGNGSDFGYGLTTSSGNIYTTGYFSATADFDPDAGTADLISIGDKDGFIQKLSCADTNSVLLEIEACALYHFDGADFDTSGVYTWKKINTSGCDSIVQLQLTVHHIEEPVITINTFELGTAIAYTSYQWIKNGAPIAGATQSTYQVHENAAYQVAVTDANGCTDTSAIYTVTNTSVDGVAAWSDYIFLYPNPATNKITIKSPFPVQSVLTGIDGRELSELTISNSISIAHLPAGIYLLRIMDQDNHLLTVKKITKE